MKSFWINTRGTTSSNLFLSISSTLATSSGVVSFVAEPWEGWASNSRTASFKRFACTIHSGCGGSGSTVRCPSKRYPESTQRDKHGKVKVNYLKISIAHNSSTWKSYKLHIKKKKNSTKRKSPLFSRFTAGWEVCEGLSSRCKCSLARAMQAFKCSFSEGSETNNIACSKRPRPALQKPGAVYLVFNTVATRHITE